MQQQWGGWQRGSQIQQPAWPATLHEQGGMSQDANRQQLNAVEETTTSHEDTATKAFCDLCTFKTLLELWDMYNTGTPYEPAWRAQESRNTEWRTKTGHRAVRKRWSERRIFFDKVERRACVASDECRRLSEADVVAAMEEHRKSNHATLANYVKKKMWQTMPGHE